MAFFIFINLVFYPTFKDQAGEFEKTFQQLPDATRQLFTDTGDFFSPVGYLSSQVYYLMLPMLLSVLAISLGVSLIGREEKDGTIELLLARPVSRAKLLLGKAAVGIIILGAVGLVATATALVMCKAVNIDVSAVNVLWASLVSMVLALCFGSIAFLISTSGRAKSASVGLASLIALGGYILVSLAGTVSWLKYPAKAFPFNYYHPSEILEGRYSWFNLVFFGAVIILASIFSWLAFRRRDLSG